METIENAKSGVDSCDKCGNPILIFWCSDCCINNELHNCDECGNPCSVDKDYHFGCDSGKMLDRLIEYRINEYQHDKDGYIEMLLREKYSGYEYCEIEEEAKELGLTK